MHVSRTLRAPSRPVRSFEKTARFCYRSGTAAALLSVALLGCSSDVAGIANPGEALLTVMTNTNAVTLAKAPLRDTIQLSVTAYRANGSVIADALVTYRASDNNIHVTEDGLVTAVRATVRSFVVSRATYRGVSQTDTTWVTVLNTTTPAPLSTFGMQIDSNLAAGTSTPISIIARDADNVDRAGVIPVRFTTSDDAVATVDRTGRLTTKKPERSITVYATTTFYGVTRTDSVRVHIGYPMLGVVMVGPRLTATGQPILVFAPTTLYIAVGGDITFSNVSSNGVANTQLIDVVFETPEAVYPVPNSLVPTGPGNIAPFMKTQAGFLSAMQIRRFPVAGTYHFRSALYGSTGIIIVR